MSSRMHRPETVKIDLTQGDWILVKKYLTAGEQRAIYSGMLRADGERVDLSRIQLSKMVGYLLDWSITDADDKPVVIRNASSDAVESMLNALDYESFVEISTAISEHEQAMSDALAQEKKSRTGETPSSPTSRSRKRTAGSTSGSPTSPSTSTKS